VFPCGDGVCPSVANSMQVGGYLGSFDLRDPGVYTLQVVLGWFFGDSEPKDPPLPLLVGGHMGHQFGVLNLLRSMLRGSPTRVVLPSEGIPPQASPKSMGKCRDGTAAGRWVNLHEGECEPPYCTGNRRGTVNAMDWVSDIDLRLRRVTRVLRILRALRCWLCASSQDGNTRRNWIFVPYDCYYHLYSKENVYSCAQKTGVDWIHSVGDSQEREFVASFNMMNSSVVGAKKFEQADFVMHGSPNNLRITWQFYTETFLWTSAFENQRQFDMEVKLFDHFNIVPSKVSLSSS
jgi:hypothetical protein